MESHLYTMSYNKSVRDGDLSGNKHSIALNTVSEVLRYIYIFTFNSEAPGFGSPREQTFFSITNMHVFKKLKFPRELRIWALGAAFPLQIIWVPNTVITIQVQFTYNSSTVLYSTV